MNSSGRCSGSGGQHPQAAARRDTVDDAPEESSPAGDVDGAAGLDADGGRDADAAEQPGTDGDEAGGDQARLATNVGDSDCDGDASDEDPVGVGDVDPELIRMVNRAIIEQLSSDD